MGLQVELERAGLRIGMVGILLAHCWPSVRELSVSIPMVDFSSRSNVPSRSNVGLHFGKVVVASGERGASMFKGPRT